MARIGRQGEAVLFLGQRKPEMEIRMDDVRIAYAVRLEGRDQIEAFSRFLERRPKRRPLEQEEVEGVLEGIRPEVVYSGAEDVRRALGEDPGLRRAFRRLAALLDGSRDRDDEAGEGA